MLTTQNEIQIAAPITASRPRWEGLRHIRYVLLQNPLTLVASILFVVLTLAAIVGPAIVPYDPLASDSARTLQPPSWQHFWGTDHLGRDVFSRSIAATGLDLSISVVAVMLSFAFGSL